MAECPRSDYTTIGALEDRLQRSWKYQYQVNGILSANSPSAGKHSKGWLSIFVLIKLTIACAKCWNVENLDCGGIVTY